MFILILTIFLQAFTQYCLPVLGIGFVIAILTLLSSKAKAQGTSTGGSTQAGYGVIITNGIAMVDSSIIMCVQRAADSITALKSQISALLNKWDTTFVATLNSGVRLSTTRNLVVRIFVSITVTSALAGANSGSVQLYRSVDNVTYVPFTAPVISSVSGVLSTQISGVMLEMPLLAGYYYKAVTVSAGANTAIFVGVLSNANQL